MESITIKWEKDWAEKGQMEIILDEFFPATVNEIYVLLRTIRLDFEHEHEHELIASILKYLNGEIPKLKCLMKEKGNLYVNVHQQVIDSETMLNTQKRPSGVRLSPDELQQIKKDHAKWKKQEQKSKHDFTSCERKLKKVQKNIELIEKKSLKVR